MHLCPKRYIVSDFLFNFVITYIYLLMSQILLYLHLEPYLAEWFVHENGGTNPISLPRGSSESDLLERFLTTPVPGRPGEVAPDDANVVIALPTFRDKDPRYYNYLPPKARKTIERNIYVRFRCEMWQELHTLDNVDAPISDLIYSWMENHGISDDPKNWETIRQMYYRKRKTHRRKVQNKKC